MKNLLKTLIVLFTIGMSTQLIAQEAEVIRLTQIDGDFKEAKTLHLKAGKAYVFEVSNEDVDHEVGFVVTPKGKMQMKDHIQNAYVQEMIQKGKTSTSKEVVLEAGEYEYFCPLNPTPHYQIMVH